MSLPCRRQEFAAEGLPSAELGEKSEEARTPKRSIRPFEEASFKRAPYKNNHYYFKKGSL